MLSLHFAFVAEIDDSWAGEEDCGKADWVGLRILGILESGEGSRGKFERQSSILWCCGMECRFLFCARVVIRLIAGAERRKLN